MSPGSQSDGTSVKPLPDDALSLLRQIERDLYDPELGIVVAIRDMRRQLSMVVYQGWGILLAFILALLSLLGKGHL